MELDADADDDGMALLVAVLPLVVVSLLMVLVGADEVVGELTEVVAADILLSAGACICPVDWAIVPEIGVAIAERGRIAVVKMLLHLTDGPNQTRVLIDEYPNTRLDSRLVM